MELRVRKVTSKECARVSTTPRLVEVWTRPGMSGLMASTPCGPASNSPRSADWSGAGSTAPGWPDSSAGGGSSEIARFGSKAPSAERHSAAIRATSARRAASSAGSRYKSADASRGMALRLLPPRTRPTSRSKVLSSSFKAWARMRMALPRPAAMSIPECPPFRPATLSLWTLRPELGATRETGRVATVSDPPAQPMVSSPSSSLSRLRSLVAFIHPARNAFAPVSPVSSSTVMRTSRGGWTRSRWERAASAAATPTPLSAPRVVPRARSTSPSFTTFIGSFAKSWTVPSFFSQTMST